ncbi:MAG: helix-turn-helix transcriptional regulator [Oscillospiraceae bacterium]|nr:helix-turn-helix transcriptional regulator [Oscillospiraceae bacterium]
MSQDELAEKLKVTRQSISLWETGQTQPSLDNILALAKLFHVSTDDLLAADESEAADTPAAPVTDAGKKRGHMGLILICVIAAAVLLAGIWLLAGGVRDRGSADPDLPVVGDKVDGEKDIYGYLKNFVVQNGGLNGDYCYYSMPADYYGGNGADDFSLYYWGDTDTVEFCLHRGIDDTFSINFYLLVPQTHTGEYRYISSYYYRDSGIPLYEAKGTITAAEFTKNYPLQCSEYIGSTEEQNDFMETSRKGVCETLECLKEFLAVEQLKYSFTDLGFTSYRS